MSKGERYMIEVDGDIGGILVGDDRGFVFHASADWAWRLNERRYPDVDDAERAITDQRRRRSPSAA